MGNVKYARLAEKYRARRWLDRQVKAVRMQERNTCFGKTVRTISPGNEVQILKGISYIAWLAGKKIRKEFLGTDDDLLYPWKYSFVYKGVCFFQMKEDAG